ncbi:MAG: Ig domain protein group 2 domain protein [Chitinophagaceae bacterium]|nr:Ig domain protein group 2 domain protein [Chitinophagaceae bacterium]
MKIRLSFLLLLVVFFKVNAQNIPTSGNTSITTCSTTLYDMGGASGGLTPNADGSITIHPASSGTVVAVLVQQLDIDYYNDYLYIYNGTSTAAPLLKTFQGGWGSSNEVDYREYYGTSGAITIRLKTGATASSLSDGCVIRVSCAPTAQLNNLVRNQKRVINSCNTTIYDEGGIYGDYQNNSIDTVLILPDAPNKFVQLTFQQMAMNNFGSGQDDITFLGGMKTSPTSTLYYISGYSNPNSGSIMTTGAPDGSAGFVMTSDAATTAQGFRILVSCSTATAVGLTQTIVPISGNASVNSCNVTVTDNGDKYNYFPNSNGALTINPATAGKKVQLVFSQFNITAGDQLSVFDGTSTTATLLGNYSGITLPANITASSANTSGALTVRFTSNGSGESAGFLFTTACVDPLPETLIPTTGSTTLTTCSQFVYDNGGNIANYSDNNNGSLLLTPGTAGMKTRLSFNSFATEATNDYLTVYDGNSATAPVIGTYSGTTIPADIIATNASGQLFLSFISNASINAAGFSISVSCVVPETKVPVSGNIALTTCNANIYDDGGSSGVYSNNADGSITLTPQSAGNLMNLSFTTFALEDQDTLFVYDGTGLTNVLAKLTGTSIPSSLRATVSNTSGALTVRLKSNSSVVNQGFAATATCYNPAVLTVIPASGNTTLTTCSSTLYDSGGSASNYALNMDGSTTVYPATAGNRIKAQFSSFATEGTYDILYVYDGTSTAATLMGSYSGTVVPSDLIATNGSGALTFRFVSDYSNVFAGFAINLTCVPPPTIVPVSGAASLTTCSGTLYDSGGSAGNYGLNQDGSMTINPATVGNKVKAQFSVFVTEGSYDKLYVYDGTSTSATLLGTYSGTVVPSDLTATNGSGALTFRFVSDYSNVFAGFAINLSCVSSTVAVTGISVSPTSASVQKGNTTSLVATITPSSATNKTVSWSSSNTSVATVDASGLVTGVAVGNATITVTSQDGNYTATSAITVTPIAVTGISVSPTSVSVQKGNTTSLTATISPAAAGNQNVTWSSSNTSVATVDASGLVTGVAVGNATITATSQDGNYTATSAITVTPIAVTGISVSPTSVSVQKGNTTSLTATISPATAGNQNVTWSSSNTSVATVDASGLVTGIAAGNATITATSQDGNYTATSAITVTPIAVTGISVSPINVSVQKGNTTSLTATITPAAADNQNVTWSSSNTSVAIVDASGLVTGVAAGNATITATSQDGNYTATSAVTVTPIAVTGIGVSPSSIVLTEGTATLLDATISPEDADNQNVTWSSSNTSIATVDAGGLVTGISIGTVIITATSEDGDYTATASVEVTTVLGVDHSQGLQEAIVLYPNPATQKVLVLNVEDEALIYITNQQGSNVYSEKLADTKEINIEQLEAGIYIVTIVSPNATATRKLVVK